MSQNNCMKLPPFCASFWDKKWKLASHSFLVHPSRIDRRTNSFFRLKQWEAIQVNQVEIWKTTATLFGSRCPSRQSTSARIATTRSHGTQTQRSLKLLTIVICQRSIRLVNQMLAQFQSYDLLLNNTLTRKSRRPSMQRLSVRSAGIRRSRNRWCPLNADIFIVKTA